MRAVIPSSLFTLIQWDSSAVSPAQNITGETHLAMLYDEILLDQLTWLTREELFHQQQEFNLACRNRQFYLSVT